MSAVVAGEAIIRAVLRLDKSTAKAAGKAAGKTLAGTMKKTGAGITKAGARLTTGLTIPIVAAGGAIINTAAQFEKSMIRVGIATNAPKSAMDQLSALAVQLGNSTVFSATDAADAMGELGRAGFSTKDIMKSVGGVLALAATEGIDLSQAAGITAKALTGMGLDADQAGRVADVLATASNKSQATVKGLGVALGYAAGQARLSGLTIEQTTGAIAVLNNNGIDASRAGTALSTMLRSLGHPTKKLQTQFEKFGISVRDKATGKMRDLGDILADVGKAGPKAIDGIASAMDKNGSRAFVALAKSAEDGDKSYASLVKQLGDKGVAGAAKRMGDQLTGGTAGAMETLSSAFETLSIAIANSGLLKVFTDIVLKITELVNYVGTLSPGKLKIGVLFAGIAAAIGPILVGVGSLISAIGTIGTVAGPILAALTGPIGLLALLVVAIGAAFVYAYTKSQPFRDWVNALAADIGAFLKGFGKGFIDQFKDFGAWFASSDLGKNLADLGTQLSRFFTFVAPGLQKAMPIFLKVGELIGKALGGQIANAVKSLIDVLGGAITFIRGFVEIIVGLFMGIFTGDWSMLQKGALHIFEGLLDTITGFLSLIFGPTVRKWIEKIFNDFIGWIKKVLGIHSPSTVMLSIARDLMQGFINGVLGFVGRIASAMGQVNARILSTIRGILGTVLGIGRDIASRLASGISGAVSRVILAVSSLRSKINDKIRDIISGMFSLGQDLVQGLINGIKNYAYRVANTARDLASTAVNAVKNFIGSHSPSKVFMQIGADTSEGYALGIGSTRSKRRVASASTDMADAAIAPARSPRTAAAAGNLTINQNYYGPQTGSGKVQEANWANRYRTSLRRFGDPAVAL